MSATTEIPAWIATLVGSLVLENQAMRRVLAETPAPTEPDVSSNGKAREPAKVS